MLGKYIAAVDTALFNTVDSALKEEWLQRLEEKLKTEFANGYKHDNEQVGVYPYDEVYVEYLKMKIAEKQGDFSRYNNYKMQFDSALEELKAFYARMYESKTDVRWTNVL